MSFPGLHPVNSVSIKSSRYKKGNEYQLNNLKMKRKKIEVELNALGKKKQEGKIKSFFCSLMNV
jgi:hypothetical protein